MRHLTLSCCSWISLTWTGDKDLACTFYDSIRHHRTSCTCCTKHVSMVSHGGVLWYAVLKRLQACASDTVSRKHSKHSAFCLWFTASKLMIYTVDRIQAAVPTVDGEMLQRTWMEPEYSLVIVRVTNGAMLNWVMFGTESFSHRWCINSVSTWRMSYSGMWRCVDLALTDVSEERIASIFRVEKSASGEPAWAGGCRQSHQSEITSCIRTGRKGE
jgi:hypothetical protein